MDEFSIRRYIAPWSQISKEPFSALFCEAITKIDVVPSNCALATTNSVRLFWISGEVSYFSLDSMSRPLAIGESVDPKECFWTTFERLGVTCEKVLVP